MGDTQNYPGKGKLGQAILDFKKHYCLGATQEWPLYWKEFADQAFADLIVAEVEKEKLKSKLEKAKDALNEIAQWEGGPVVNSGFDCPGNAETARKALEEIEGEG